MTTDPHGWPDPARPGYPMHPERDGWHWVEPSRGIGITSPRLWHARVARWEMSDGTLIFASEAAEMWRYLNPCLTPAEVAAAVQAEREVCATVAGDNLRNTGQLLSSPPKSAAAWDIRNAIRARGDTSALDAALAQARREGMEAAARIAYASTWGIWAAAAIRSAAGEGGK